MNYLVEGVVGAIWRDMTMSASLARAASGSCGRVSPAAPADDRWYRCRRPLEAVLVPAVALVLAAAGFSLFLLFLGKSPGDFFALVWRGAFGSWFSLQNTLQRAAPLLLTALCVALPAQLGLVIIGGEGAVVLGGLAAAVTGSAAARPAARLPVQIAMALAGMAVGGAWIGLAGWLQARRGVNETIASLLLAYIAIAILNHLRRGAAARSREPQQALDHGIGDADHARHHARHGCASGPRWSASSPASPSGS